MPDKIEGHRSGEISDALRAWTERVAEILNALIVTADIADDAITNAKLRNSAACSVIGRAGNTVGDPADIATATNDRLLARVSNVLQWVQLNVNMIPNSLITYAKIQNGGACSIPGRSANSAGVLADISAALNDRLLTRVGDILAFTQLTAGMIPNSLVTNAMRANMAESTISGRAAGAGAGAPQDLTASQVIAVLGAPMTFTPYAPGSFTLPTGYGLVMTGRLILTGSQRATLEGTARLRIT